MLRMNMKFPNSKNEVARARMTQSSRGVRSAPRSMTPVSRSGPNVGPMGRMSKMFDNFKNSRRGCRSCSGTR